MSSEISEQPSPKRARLDDEEENESKDASAICQMEQIQKLLCQLNKTKEELGEVTSMLNDVCGLKMFPSFPRLPLELRQMIYSKMSLLEAARLIRVDEQIYEYFQKNPFTVDKMQVVWWKKLHSHTVTPRDSDVDWKHLLHGAMGTANGSDSATCLSGLLLEDHRNSFDAQPYFSHVIPQPHNEVDDWKSFVEAMHPDAEEMREMEYGIDPNEKRLKQEENTGKERKKWARFREKAFVCDYCEREFTLKQNVQCHIYTYHMQGKSVRIMQKAKQYPCTKCEKMFRTPEKVERHERKMHNPNAGMKKMYTCQHCSKVYHNMSQVKEHIDVTHLNYKPHNCTDCGLSFGRKGGLRRHRMMVHLGMVYKCTYEGCTHPGYKCSKALTAHIRSVHTGDRPFHCMLCEKSFVRKNDLRQHELTHENNGVHECVYCKQVFKRSVYLTKHKRTCHVRMAEYGIECKPIVRRQPSLRVRGIDSLRGNRRKSVIVPPEFLRRGRSAGLMRVKEEVRDADDEMNGESGERGEAAEKTERFVMREVKQEEPDDYSSVINVEEEDELIKVDISSDDSDCEEIVDNEEDGESMEDEESTDSESDEEWP